MFIGSQLDESPLWHYINLRGTKGPGRELRPRSFIVSPSLPKARAAMLEQFNIVHIPATASEFAEEYVTPAASRPVLISSAAYLSTSAWLDVATARLAPKEDAAEFLMGRDPVWSDYTDGFAIEREFDKEIIAALTDASHRINIITGTAGAGKSTTLMRLALAMQSLGHKTLWLDPDSGMTFHRIPESASVANPDYCFVDDAGRFGDRLPDLVVRLLELPSSPRVAIAMTGASSVRKLTDQLAPAFSAVLSTVPHLEDPDIELLINALDGASRLGRLKGLPRHKQVEAFREKAGRQLLVAMIEATSGQRFEEKIADECRDLSGAMLHAYAVISLATWLKYPLPQSDAVSAVGGPTALSAVDDLVRSHLVLRDKDKRLRARHSVIAQRVVNYYRQSGQLTQAIGDLTFTLSNQVWVGMPKSRVRRLLTALINHDFLNKHVSSRAEVQAIYQNLEAGLQDDPHFWLQRGSYELEFGDLSVADNFLAQARGLADRSDFMIDTEWCYLLLEQGRRDPRDARLAERADEALELLYEIVSVSGKKTPNTYAVLAQSGTQWLEVSPMDNVSRRQAFMLARTTVQEGLRLHPTNPGLRAAAQDLERRYLLLATR